MPRACKWWIAPSWANRHAGATTGASPPTRRADWLVTQNNLINNYFPTRTQNVRAQFNSRGWLVSVAAPLFSQYGGTVDPGFQLTLTKPAGSPAGGQIYYTLDGSDPRDATTKMPSAAAILYSGPIALAARCRGQLSHFRIDQSRYRQ